MVSSVPMTALPVQEARVIGVFKEIPRFYLRIYASLETSVEYLQSLIATTLLPSTLRWRQVLEICAPLADTQESSPLSLVRTSSLYIVLLLIRYLNRLVSQPVLCGPGRFIHPAMIKVFRVVDGYTFTFILFDELSQVTCHGWTKGKYNCDQSRH